MISHLKGTVAAVGGTWLVVDLSGFGIRALCTPATVAAVRVGQPCELHTSLVVREDSLTVYAFSDPEERDAFEIIQSATGIGPKIAQAVVSVMSPAELREAISTENVVALTKVPGIGRKGAQRMVLELKDKINTLSALPDLSTTAPIVEADPVWREQVRSGLESLGWSTRDADAACERVAYLADEDPGIGIAALMKAALRSLAR